jgi:cytochrome o ubiquinol oxidase operon protein cyoD
MKEVEKQSEHLSLKGYVFGFGLSLALTLLAFMFVNAHITSQHGQFTHEALMIVLSVFALTQFIVQMIFFLHLGTERKPRWKLLVFWLMIIIVLILVVGSVWIMQNLNYNMMSPQETMDYMEKHQGF